MNYFSNPSLPSEVGKKWDEKSQVTQRMLQEYFKCEEERMMIGKKNMLRFV